MEKGKISGDSQHSEAPPTVNDSWNRRTHKKTRTEAGGSNAKPRERNGGDRVTTGTAEQEQKRKRICLKIRTDQAVENVLDGKKI
jgi:hypothetical protein